MLDLRFTDQHKDSSTVSQDLPDQFWDIREIWKISKPLKISQSTVRRAVREDHQEPDSYLKKDLKGLIAKSEEYAHHMTISVIV